MGKFPKDPNAPKRPKSGYFLFLAQERPRVIQQLGTNKIGVIGKELGRRWKEQLSDEQRNRFNAQSKQEMVVWKQQMEAYKKTDGYQSYMAEKRSHDASSKGGGNFAKQEKKLKKMLKNKPKGGMSAYMMFSCEERKRIVTSKPELNGPGGFAAIGKMISERWKTISDSRKADYNARAAVSKSEAKAKMAAYKETEEWKSYEIAKKALNKSKSAAKRKAKKIAKQGFEVVQHS